jgi:hypothetical protein
MSRFVTLMAVTVVGAFTALIATSTSAQQTIGIVADSGTGSPVTHDKPSAMTAENASPPGAPTSSLEKLKKYTDAWKVLHNPTVVHNMKAVMGNKYSLFEERTQSLDQVEMDGDEIFSQGGVQGLYTITEGAFDLNIKTGRVQVALLDNSALDIWGAASTSDLSVGMSKYIKDLQDRKGNETELQVRFEAPNESTIASQPAKKTKVKKHLSVASPSGTYERESRWEGATLQIVKLEDNKIKFHLQAAHGANTGEASGVIPLFKNKGTYVGEGFKLTFDYRGNVIGVEQSGSGFGGLNVDAGGIYKKTDDKVPVISSDN